MIDNFLELSDKELTHIDRNKHVIRNINETQMYTNDSINSGKLSEKNRKIKEEKLDEIMSIIRQRIEDRKHKATNIKDNSTSGEKIT